MFMQSFENTDKQQQRRRSRQLAMQRMERAAAVVPGASGASRRSGRRDSGGSGSSGNEVEKLAAKVKAKSMDHGGPWRPNTTLSPDDDGAVEDDFSYKPPEKSKSFHAANNFLRETQRQHETRREHVLHPSRSPPSLEAPPSPQFSLSSRMTLSHLKGRMESNAARQFFFDDGCSVASNYTQRSNGANSVNLHDIKNSLRDANGTGASPKAEKRGHDWRAARWSAIQDKSKKASSELWNVLPPLWGGGGDDSRSVASGTSGRSGKYRDEEGERLLGMASERLSTPQPSPGNDDAANRTPTTRNNNKSWRDVPQSSPGVTTISPKHHRGNSEMPMFENLAALRATNEYGDIEEGDDDSFIGEIDEDDHKIEDDDDDSFTKEPGNHRVFLDKDANLTYNDRQHDTDDGNYHKRRMMNQYRRTFKKPCILMGAAVGVVAIVYGAHGLYSKMFSGMSDNFGGGHFNGNVSTLGSNWSESVAARDDDWAEFNKLTNENAGEEETEEEQDAAAQVDAIIESPREELPQKELPQKELPAAELPAAELPAAELPAAELPAAEESTQEELPPADESTPEVLPPAGESTQGELLPAEESAPEDSPEVAAAEVASNIESPQEGLQKEGWPPAAAPPVGGSPPKNLPGAELPSPYKERFDHLRYTLVNRGASPPEVFLDTRSAQYAALIWLAKDDPRQLDPESVYLGQRFGLAVLWYGTTKSGYEWHIPEHFVADDENGGEEDEDYEMEEEDDEYIDYAEYDDGDTSWDDDYDYDEEEGSNTIVEYADYAEYEKHVDEWPPRHTRNLNVEDPSVWSRHGYWLSSSGVCGWEGVRCHPRENGNVHDGDNDGDVSHLELRRNNLHGLIPDEVYRTLPYLKVLDLSDNGLAGTLSDEVLSMNRLETLNLTSNNIAGSLTSEIGKLTSLKELHLANNLLGESIPHSIGTLTNLKHLDLSGNSIRGTMPYEMGRLTNLSALDLSYNLLVGPLPHEFSELKAMVSLDASHNNLGGPLIVELSYIKYLTTLRLNDNHFSGEVPAEIGNLAHLEELRLNNNDFGGTLPGEISNLGGLDVLSVADNHFQGEFPPEWTSMAGLRELDVSSNELKGEIPIFVDGMKNLRSLNMARNDFSSAIPSELGRLYKLEYLYLDDNEFTSTVPKEFGELTDLKKMALHNNYLTGEVDGRICKLADELFLTQLSVDCGGEMPSIFCDCCICHDREPIVHLNTEP